MHTGQIGNNHCPGYSGTGAAEEVKNSGDNDNENTGEDTGNKSLSKVVVSNRIRSICMLSKQIEKHQIGYEKQGYQIDQAQPGCAVDQSAV